MMPGREHITLSALTAKIKAVIENNFRNESYWIVADVVDHNFYTSSRWHYFGLVEKHATSIMAKMKAVAPADSFDAIRNFERQTGQKFRSGISVLINVSVTYHAEYGLQLSLNDIDANYTLGQIAQQREATIQRLLTECSDFVQLKDGRFFTKNGSLPFRPVIQNIALISSHNARGYEDFKTTIEENKHGYKLSLDIYYSAVQGENNVGLLFNTLIKVFESKKAYDAVIIVRGGGGDTDFLIFDHYDIARAIAKYPIPIIVGIGHHINETIADLMAHTSTKTPSIAAEFILAHNKKFEDSIIALGNQTSVRSLQAINSRRNKLFPVKSILTDNANTALRTEERRLNVQPNIVMNKSRQILSKQHNALEEQLARTSNKPQVVIANTQKVLGYLHSAFINNSKNSIRQEKDGLSAAVQLTKNSLAKVFYKKQGLLTEEKTQIKAQSLMPLLPCKNELTIQSERIRTYGSVFLMKHHQRIDGLEGICRVMSPMNILRKGFALVFSGDKIARNASAINPNDNLKIRFSQTIVDATANTITKTTDNEFDI